MLIGFSFPSLYSYRRQLLYILELVNWLLTSFSWDNSPDIQPTGLHPCEPSVLLIDWFVWGFISFLDPTAHNIKMLIVSTYEVRSVFPFNNWLPSALYPGCLFNDPSMFIMWSLCYWNNHLVIYFLTISSTLDYTASHDNVTFMKINFIFHLFWFCFYP